MNAPKPLLFLSLLFLICSCKKENTQTKTAIKTDTTVSNTEFTHSTTSLSEGRYGLTGASSGSKIIFVGGVANVSIGVAGSKNVDIYDVSTGTWTKNQADNCIRMSGAGAGDQFVFAGGYSGQTLDTFDSSIYIFNSATTQWTTTKLPDQISLYPAAAATGNKIFFAGGMMLSGNLVVNYDDKVHVYDASKNSWSNVQLSEGRGYMAAATVGNIVMFGGGYNLNGLSSKVDMYNSSTNIWTTANLSEARNNLVAAAAGTKIIFAGGNNSKSGSESKVVDIYDIVTNTWTTAQLSEAKLGMCAAAAGNKIMFAGGYSYDRTKGAYIYSKTIDIYDVITGKWSTAELSEPKSAFAAAASGNKIVFAGGINDTGIALKSVDIFTIK